MRYFISTHKRLTVGVILYIAVFIVSIFISPWQIEDITVAEVDADSSNLVMNKIPINIIYFGIYEIYELLAYSGSDTFTTNSIMFFFSACALFTYAYFIRKLFISNDDITDTKIEKIALDFIYDNIFAYIICLLSYYFYKPVSEKVLPAFESDNFWIKALAIIMLIMFIIVPSIPQLLQLLAYVFLISKTSDLLNWIDKSLEWNIIIKTIFIFLVAVLAIILTNLIINILLDRLQIAVAEFFMTAFPMIGALILGFIKLCIGGIILAIILMLITKFL